MHMKSSTFAGMVLLCAVTAGAQDTTWHSLTGPDPSDRALADYYLIAITDPTDSLKKSMYGWYTSGGKYNERHFRYHEGKWSGPSMEWHPNGVMKTQMNFKDAQPDGLLQTWWDNGQLRRRETYENGELLEGVCFDSEGSEVPHFPFLTNPQYPGGEEALMKYLSTSIIYPKDARRSMISGMVFISFSIDRLGDVHDIHVLRSVHPLLDEEAMRVVSAMPRWQPGTQDGEAVKVRYNLPVRFNLK